MKEYRAKKKVSDIEAYRRREADYNLRRYDGMSLDEYGRLLSEQDGGCAICGAKAVGHKGRNRFHVDHDHSTGMVRGLLCHGCNAGIGNLGDDAERIAKAAAYLRRKKAN